MTRTDKLLLTIAMAALAIAKCYFISLDGGAAP